MPTFNQDSEEIQYLCTKDPLLAKGIALVGSLSYMNETDGFPFLGNIIVSQMLSAKVADVIWARLVLLCDGKFDIETVKKLEINQMRAIGLSNRKAQNILNLASYLLEHPQFLEDFAILGDEEIVNELTALKGIGPWTAKMYLIFALDRRDVLPYEDGAFLQAYRWLYRTEDLSVSSIKKCCEPWTPYASLASRYLYRLLDLGFTKEGRA
ncbi:hypothetical protein [uncultured Sphaerochaeta sp.]|uniref:DNA-3-methyladenine glycosylase family protein n=1 Tax=uncultured Sphaerochaeta sp. TaxID=886478 RepID=UPI002A0A4745|nr:hypothetical protein [uncultured Sphaerochaeta sp.]